MSTCGIRSMGGHGFVVVPVDISFQTVGVLFFSPAGEALVTSVAGVFLLLGSSASAYRQVCGSYIPAIPRVFCRYVLHPKVQYLHQ